MNTANSMIKLVNAVKASIDNSSRVRCRDFKARSAARQGNGSDKVLKCYQC